MEHKESKNNQSEQQEEKKNLKNVDSISHLWDNFQRSTICIIGVPEGEKKEQEIGNLLEKIIKENFSNLAKEIHTQVQEAQRFPNKIRAKRPTPRHIIIMPNVKDKERILKAVREKKSVTYRGVPIRLSADCSKETAG